MSTHRDIEMGELRSKINRQADIITLAFADAHTSRAAIKKMSRKLSRRDKYISDLKGDINDLVHHGETKRAVFGAIKIREKLISYLENQVTVKSVDGRFQHVQLQGIAEECRFWEYHASSEEERDILAQL